MLEIPKLEDFIILVPPFVPVPDKGKTPGGGASVTGETKGERKKETKGSTAAPSGLTCNKLTWILVTWRPLFSFFSLLFSCFLFFLVDVRA